MGVSQIKQLQWAVRMVLTLGIAASVAANVLHANPNPISQTISAWPPVALLLTVELTSRIPVSRWHLATVRITATAVIAGIAAWVSYWHMVGVTARYGETGSSSYLLPITVDGLVVVASVSLVELNAKLRALLDVAVQPVKVDEPVAPAPAAIAQAVESVPTQPAASTRETRAKGRGRSGPQVAGRSNAGLSGKALMEDTPQV